MGQQQRNQRAAGRKANRGLWRTSQAAATALARQKRIDDAKAAAAKRIQDAKDALQKFYDDNAAARQKVINDNNAHHALELAKNQLANASANLNAHLTKLTLNKAATDIANAAHNAGVRAGTIPKKPKG